MGPREIADTIRYANQTNSHALALWELLMESLPPLHQEIWLTWKDKEITTAAVVEQLNIKRNHAGNILKDLYDWGLLEREYRDKETGYVYTRRSLR